MPYGYMYPLSAETEGERDSFDPFRCSDRAWIKTLFFGIQRRVLMGGPLDYSLNRHNAPLQVG